MSEHADLHLEGEGGIRCRCLDPGGDVRDERSANRHPKSHYRFTRLTMAYAL